MWNVEQVLVIPTSTLCYQHTLLNMLVGATDSHMSLLTKITEGHFSLEGNRLHKFLRNARFYLTIRNPPVFQVELISRLWDSHLELRGLKVPLDLKSDCFSRMTLPLFSQNSILRGYQR